MMLSSLIYITLNIAQFVTERCLPFVTQLHIFEIKLNLDKSQIIFK